MKKTGNAEAPTYHSKAETEDKMQINRLFEIVYILLKKKHVTAKELSEHFEVSQRTIYRDIEALCEAGIPIYANRGKGGGICLMDQFVLNKSLLTKEEQSDILSALQGLQVTSNIGPSSALSKLRSLFQTDDPDWIEVDFSYWNSREEDRRSFTLLKEAIWNRKVISFRYFNSYGQESFRVAEPLKLLFKGQAWYLSAYCREKQSFRFFKISRMEGLEVSEETFALHPENTSKKAEPALGPTAQDRQPAEGAVQDRQLAEGAVQDRQPAEGAVQDRQLAEGEEPVMFTIKVAASMAFRIFDEFPKEDVTRLEDGSFLVRSRIQPAGWLYGYLLSYEDQLELLEPEDLRMKLADKIKKLKEIYHI